MPLTKRAWDRRILHVDLRPALREGDTPARIVSVTASIEDGGPAPTFSDSILDGTTASFLAIGGGAGYYNILVRFEVDSQPGQRIEAAVGLRVR